MQILKKEGYQTITLDQLYDYLRGDMPEILAAAGYKAAYTVYGGENIPGQPLAFLNRFMVRQGDDERFFLQKVTRRPLPLLAMTPERGSKVSVGDTIRLTLPQDIRIEDLSLFIDKVTVKFTTARETPGGKEISLVMPSPRSRNQWYREIDLQLREGAKLYRSTFLYLVK